MSRTLTGKVQQLLVQAPWACTWIGMSINDARVLLVEYPMDGPDAQAAAEAAAKVEGLAAALAGGQIVEAIYGDNDVFISGVILHAGTAPLPPLDERYRLRTDFTVDDPHNDARYVKVNDFTAFDPRYVRVGDFAALDPRYVHVNDFAAFDPRYLAATTVHDAVSGSNNQRHHTILAGTATVNVSASGQVTVTAATLGFPGDTSTRRPIVLHAAAWAGTNVLLASVGQFNGTGWPVRVYDPSGAFTTGPATVEIAVRLDV